MDDEQQRLSALLQIYQRRLQLLEKQAAILGVYAPPHVQIEIEDTRAAMAQLAVDLSQTAPAPPGSIAQRDITEAPVAQPPVQPSPQRTNNLPASLTTLIGRQQEASAACIL